MRLNARATGPGSVERVLERLQPEHVDCWVGGHVRPRPDGCEIRFSSPVSFAIRVELRTVDGGVLIRLMEGKLKELEGSLLVEPHEDGAAVGASLDVAFPMPVPGTLMRELEHTWLRWLQRLVS